MGLWGAHHDSVVTLLSHKEMVNNWVVAEAIERVKCEGGINAARNTNDSQTFNLLFYAAYYRNKVAFNIILRCGINIMWRNNEGINIMQMLAKNNYIKWAEWCLTCIGGEEEKIFQFINNIDINGLTPLMMATQNNHFEMVEWLIQQCADVNTGMRVNWTAMHVAAKCGHSEILKLLLDSGGKKTLQAVNRHFGVVATIQAYGEENAAIKHLLQDLYIVKHD